MACKWVQKATVFVPGRLFQPGLKFVGKARSLPQSGASEKCFTCVGCYSYDIGKCIVQTMAVEVLVVAVFFNYSGMANAGSACVMSSHSGGTTRGKGSGSR
jgi:hypothetical protein